MYCKNKFPVFFLFVFHNRLLNSTFSSLNWNHHEVFCAKMHCKKNLKTFFKKFAFFDVMLCFDEFFGVIFVKEFQSSWDGQPRDWKSSAKLFRTFFYYPRQIFKKIRLFEFMLWFDDFFLAFLLKISNIGAKKLYKNISRILFWFFSAAIQQLFSNISSFFLFMLWFDDFFPQILSFKWQFDNP